MGILDTFITNIPMSERQRDLFLLYLANPILGNIVFEGDTDLNRLFAITSINLLPTYNSVEGCTNYCDADDVLHLCEECERKFIENTLVKVPALLPVALFDQDNMANIDLLIQDLDKFRGFILLNTVDTCPADRLEHIYAHYNWLMEQNIIPHYSIIGLVNKGGFKNLPEIVKNSVKLVYRDTSIFDENELNNLKWFYQENMEMSEVTVEEFHASRYAALKLARAKALYPSIEIPHNVISAISNKIKTATGVDKVINNLEIIFQETLATYISLSDKIVPDTSDINDITPLMLPRSYAAAPVTPASPFARKMGGGMGGIGMPRKAPPTAPASMPNSRVASAPAQAMHKPPSPPTMSTPPGRGSQAAATAGRAPMAAAPQQAAPTTRQAPAKPAFTAPKPGAPANNQQPQLRQAPAAPTPPPATRPAAPQPVQHKPVMTAPAPAATQPPINKKPAPAPQPQQRNHAAPPIPPVASPQQQKAVVPPPAPVVEPEAASILPVNDTDKQGSGSIVRQTLTKKPQPEPQKKDKKELNDIIDNLIDKSRGKQEQVKAVTQEIEQLFDPGNELDSIFVTHNKQKKVPPPPAAAPQAAQPPVAVNELQEEFDQIQTKIDNLIKDTKTAPAAPIPEPEPIPEPVAATPEPMAQPVPEVNPLIQQLMDNGPEGLEDMLKDVVDTKSSFVFNAGASAIKTEAELQEERAAAAAAAMGRPGLGNDETKIHPEPQVPPPQKEVSPPPPPAPKPKEAPVEEKPKPKPPAPAQPVEHHTERPARTMTLFFGFDISKNAWSADAISNFCEILNNNAFMYPVDLGILVFNDKDSALLIEPTPDYHKAFEVLDSIVLKGKSNLADGLKIGIQSIKEYMAKLQSDMASLVIVTDGKSAYSSVPGKSGTEMAKTYAQNIANDGINCWIVDYDNGFLRFGFAEEVAKIAKCKYSLVPSNDYNALLDKINGILSFYNEKYRIL